MMIYTEEQQAIRDRSVWTVVQAVLAPLQFLVFLISLGLVVTYLTTGDYYTAATISVIFKTFILYTIMVTGAIWEKVVFGQYLFAKPFFWEDVFSMLVLALHSLYLIGLWVGWDASALMLTALAAYASYVVNAGQFLWKLRQAKGQRPRSLANQEAPA